jgi:hypothetical protein
MENSFVPKTADDFTVEEKCKAFDELFKMARDHYDSVVEDGRYDSDDRHYMYEALVSLLGDGVWDVLNSKM